jgi:hypothetical protein
MSRFVYKLSIPQALAIAGWFCLSFIASITKAQTTPQAHSYKPVSTATSAQQKPNNGLRFPQTANYAGQTNSQIRNSTTSSRAVDPASEVKAAVRGSRTDATEARRLKAGRYLNNAYELLRMNPDSFSVSKAIYLSESSYYSNPANFSAFEKAIKEKAELVRQILKREGLSDTNNIAIHYAIQKLYTRDYFLYDTKTKRIRKVPKLRYDFTDYMGEQHWEKVFLTKLLASGSGQCHSLPLFYLCLMEQLGGKAYLSLSPNHSFIQYFDDRGHRYNFETTNGNLVTNAWLMQSTYVNATALKNGTYLDTLSKRQLFAQIASDLLLNYIMTFGYDEFSDQLTDGVLMFDHKNLTALMTKANLLTFTFQEKAKKAGNPPVKDLDRFPELKALHGQMQQLYREIAATGYQQMPEKVYKEWLKSVELEKKKQENVIERERMTEEIKRQKAVPPGFKNLSEKK